ncbi:MAG: hypothetical protein HYR85_22925 [Planctomycetes bacterium]|nr:hypothetical protein [Planctomycetota bacterium]
MAVGLLMLVVGLFAAPDRAWPNLLISIYYLTGLGLGAGFFIAIQYLSNAGWSVGIRRIAEASTSILPVAAIGAVVLMFGIHNLYEWSHSSLVAGDSALQGKSVWLNPTFFAARIAAYFVIWIVLSKAIVRNSERQDKDGDPLHTSRNVRNSALFVVSGLCTSVLASMDFLMSLQPHWYSTMFAFASLSGSFLSGLAAITVLVVVLRRLGYRELFRDEHLCDLGRLMLAFSVFWVYLWVSQHLLIWYANIPEETTYYVVRHAGSWGTLSVVNVLLNWAVPFLVLLPRASKRSETVMAAAAMSILVGHWLDLFIIVMPSKFRDAPPLGIWEIGAFTGILAVFFGAAFRSLGKRSLVPVGDPYLVESLPARGH